MVIWRGNGASKSPDKCRYACYMGPHSLKETSAHRRGRDLFTHSECAAFSISGRLADVGSCGAWPRVRWILAIIRHVSPLLEKGIARRRIERRLLSAVIFALISDNVELARSPERADPNAVSGLFAKLFSFLCFFFFL